MHALTQVEGRSDSGIFGAPVEIAPVLDLPPAVLQGYRRELVVAEKLHAMVVELLSRIGPQMLAKTGPALDQDSSAP